ncbi:MAG: sugar phosphate nucleotidyltransferase, partial [Pseudomonadota bacterium]
MASFPHTAMILGAGLGERARPLSLVRPKPLFPVLNRPIIAHTLDHLGPLGLRQVVVNTHHLASRLEAYLSGFSHGPAIRTVREEVILGTGGGLRHAAPFLGRDPFLVINGDIVTGVDLAALAAEHEIHGPMATLVLHDCPAFNQVAVDGDGFIRGFRGNWPRSREEQGWRVLAFTGVHLVDPWVLTRLPEGPGD